LRFDERPLPDPKVVGILGRDPRLDQQRRAFGDDIHQLLARRDDAAGREYGEPDHRPGSGRADGGALELVARRGPARQYVAEPVVDVAKIGGAPLAERPLGFESLDLALARGTAGLRDAGAILAALTDQLRARAFELAHPGL
jgi:hypothetical protein